MAENLHNDNLERFFKENLERYSPTPSGDFWARMEPAIPPKPAVWKGFVSKYLKWIGLGLLLLTLATMFVLWRKDRQRIDQLSKQIAVAQQQVQALAYRQADKAIGNDAEPKLEAQNTLTKATEPITTTANTTFGEAKASANSTGSSGQKGQNPAQVPVYVPRGKGANNGKGVKSPAGPRFETPSKLVENQVIANQEPPVQIDSKTDEPQNVQPNDQTLQVNAIVVQPTLGFVDPTQLPLTYPLVSSIKNQTPSVKHQGIKPNRKPYPRISYECGAAVFAMPLARLFNRDTNYAGSIKPSWSVSFAINYDLSPYFALQGGYQLKNIRTSKMALRYHSVPMLVVKKWNVGRRLSMEAKAGLVVNKFYNRRTYSDGLSVRGRKDLWLGWQSGFQLGIPVGENMTMLIGPYGGTGITAFANGKRTWEAGISTNLRYQF